MKNIEIQRILLVGNAAGGKTRLSRRLGQIHQLPVFHVDSIQFLPGMIIRPLDETRKVLSDITAQEQWIIDGHGPLDQIEKRFSTADRIVFVDLPIWRHYWWFTKRQIRSLWMKRLELADGCNEATWAHSQKVIKTMWKIHQQMRPELTKIFSKETLRNKVVIIQEMKQWNQIFNDGLS